MLTYRPSEDGDFPHFGLVTGHDWGLIIYDEVHLLPAPIFRITAEIQARRRLGLTATLVREDGREADVFGLIGPKRFDVPWRELERQGWIATAECHEIRVRAARRERLTYAVSEEREKYRMAAENPVKIEWCSELTQRHAEDQVLIIGQYLDQLKELADLLDAPLLTGRTNNSPAREALRSIPPGRDQAAGGEQGRQLRHRSARRQRRHPGVGHVWLAPGGGAAPGAAAAPQGGRAAGAFLHHRHARHPRPGVLRQSPALPDRAGLSLHHRRRRDGGASRRAARGSSRQWARLGQRQSEWQNQWQNDWEAQWQTGWRTEWQRQG